MFFAETVWIGGSEKLVDVDRAVAMAFFSVCLFVALHQCLFRQAGGKPAP